jgi:hypothetical protein
MEENIKAVLPIIIFLPQNRIALSLIYNRSRQNNLQRQIAPVVTDRIAKIFSRNSVLWYC